LWCRHPVFQVGIALDASTVGSCVFNVSVNGNFDKPNGKAFMMAALQCSPAFSGQRGRYCVNFGDRPFQYSPPDSSFVTHSTENRIYA
jgi:hypothetical protein